jgi:hypothetical protein
MLGRLIFWDKNLPAQARLSLPCEEYVPIIAEKIGNRVDAWQELGLPSEMESKNS